MKTNLLITFLACCGIAVACSENPENNSGNSSTDLTGEALEQPQKDVTRSMKPETQEANPLVVLETTKGNITIELFPEKAPATVDNFLDYVNSGFYDSTIFHRVIDGFMIQGGGFTADGNKKQTREPIKLESDTDLSNDIGTVAMARTNAPNSATSQFFINVSDNKFLNRSAGKPGYAVFGKVIDGMEIVNVIRQVPTTAKGPHQNWPVEPVLIKKAYEQK